jgi:hypothetical protein
MQNANLHAGTNQQKMQTMEGKKNLPGAEEAAACGSECFAGGAVVEAGGGAVAHGRRLQAAVLLFQTVEGEVTALPFSSVCLPLLSFLVVSLYPPGLLSSFLPRFKLFLPLRLSLSVVPFLFGLFSLLGSFSVSLRFLSVRSPSLPPVLALSLYL